jgi:hypothetical protein
MRNQLRAWGEQRSAPVVATIAMFVIGMAFSLWPTHGVVHLRSPSDLWSLSTSASAILHGHFNHIYRPNSALTSPPALEFVLVPFVALGTVLGLNPHIHGGAMPLSMWFVFGPATLLLGSSALFAVDAIARSWRLSEKRRLGLALASALGVGDVVVGWGHPEDCIALALVLRAALSVSDTDRADRADHQSLVRAGWLLGVAVAFQPLAILGAAAILARTDLRSLPRTLVWLGLPSLVVLALPLVASPHETLQVIVRQPFQPHYINRTPFTRFATRLRPGVLSGGPTRLISTLLGALAGWLVCRRRHDLPTILTMIALGFELRVLLESELNWYYLWPVCALCLLLTIRSGWSRLLLTTAGMAATMALCPHRARTDIPWWPELMAVTLVMLVVAATATAAVPVEPPKRALPARPVHTIST